MGRNERKIDQFISVIVLLLYAVVIAIKWVLVYQTVPPEALTAVDIIGTVVLCLMFLVVLYNACCWTDSIIIKIIFAAIALFLIASAIAIKVPEVQEYFYSHNIPFVI